MRIFKNKWFARFTRKNRIDDSALKSAVADIEAGNFDADLGGNVYKQRIARKGQGGRGGYRTILIYKQGDRAFFISGYAKKELDNIGDDVLLLYKNLAKLYLAMTEVEISASKSKGELIEI